MTNENEKQLEAKPRELPVVHDSGRYLNLLDSSRYEHIQRIAAVYCRSNMIPAHFRGKIEDVFVVCQMAFRMQVDPLMMLQNTYVVSGKPGIAGQMAIALVNASGAFRGRIKFRYEGQGMTRSCVAWAIDKQTGETLECRVDMQIAVAEGWTKNNKWKSMPDQMLAYRSGAWFARLYCPDALFGMSTIDELEDMGMINVTPKAENNEKAAELDAILGGNASESTPDAVRAQLKTADELEAQDLAEEAKQLQALAAE